MTLKVEELLAGADSSAVVAATGRIISTIWPLSTNDRQRCLRTALMVVTVLAAETSKRKRIGQSLIDRHEDLLALVVSMDAEGHTISEITSAAALAMPPKKRPSRVAVGRWLKKYKDRSA